MRVEGLAHKGYYFCPLCRELVHHSEIFKHLKSHGFEVVFKRKIKVVKKPVKAPKRLTVYEWGSPFWELYRRIIPEENYETELVYNAECQGYVTDSEGNRVNIGNPSLLCEDIRHELRQNGLEAQYIKIIPETGDILTQGKGSPVPWYVKFLIAAIAFAIIAYFGSTAFKLITESVYRIFVAPIPPEWRPIVYAIIGVGALTTVAIILTRR